jgi:hypothetical protein
MRFTLGIALMLLILGAPGEPRAPSGSDLSNTAALRGLSLQQVAVPLRNAWLRFHENDLCLGVDAVFVFQPKGMEIWCRAKDEKSLQELKALLAPLQSSYRIDLYATYSDREKKPWAREDDDPPPSLWNNAELRNYFRDPGDTRWSVVDDSASDLIPDPRQDLVMRRRMKLYSDQIVEWLKKMDRFAKDLSSLAEAGYGKDPVPEIQARARTVSLDHVREIGRYAGRLLESLRHAFPRSPGDGLLPQGPKPIPDMSDSPYAGALRVSAQAQDLNQKILRFLYPQNYTVTLTDLRDPGLLDLAKVVQQSAAEFERNARNAR